MMKKGKRLFVEELGKVQRFSLGIKLLFVPYRLLIPAIVSWLVMESMRGKVLGVVQVGIVMLLVVTGFEFLNVRLLAKYKQIALREKQACKLKLFKAFFKNTRETLFCSGFGENLENVSNDFDVVTDRILEDSPAFWVCMAEVIIWEAYLFWKNPLTAAALLMIAFFQLIPPAIVKKYMQVYYDQCREIEGKITDFTVTARRGLLTLKMYRLQDWWLDRMGGIV